MRLLLQVAVAGTPPGQQLSTSFELDVNATRSTVAFADKYANSRQNYLSVISNESAAVIINEVSWNFQLFKLLRNYLFSPPFSCQSLTVSKTIQNVTGVF